jgi:hypothetical protein
MADIADQAEKAKQAILETVATLADGVRTEAQARAVLALAEATRGSTDRASPTVEAPR